MPPKKHGLSTNFLVENLLNACLEGSGTEKSLTGFSESQQQVVDEQISSGSKPKLSDSSASDSNFDSSVEEESTDEQDDGIVELFKKKGLDVDSFPGVIKRLSEMNSFSQT